MEGGEKEVGSSCSTAEEQTTTTTTLPREEELEGAVETTPTTTQAAPIREKALTQQKLTGFLTSKENLVENPAAGRADMLYSINQNEGDNDFASLSGGMQEDDPGYDLQLGDGIIQDGTSQACMVTLADVSHGREQDVTTLPSSGQIEKIMEEDILSSGGILWLITTKQQ